MVALMARVALGKLALSSASQQNLRIGSIKLGKKKIDQSKAIFALEEALQHFATHQKKGKGGVFQLTYDAEGKKGKGVITETKFDSPPGALEKSKRRSTADDIASLRKEEAEEAKALRAKAQAAKAHAAKARAAKLAKEKGLPCKKGICSMSLSNAGRYGTTNRNAPCTTGCEKEFVQCIKRWSIGHSLVLAARGCRQQIDAEPGSKKSRQSQSIRLARAGCAPHCSYTLKMAAAAPAPYTAPP